jgi:RNA polymerase sigma factor (sigma-70 family)
MMIDKASVEAKQQSAPRKGASVADAELDDWFINAVLIHEPSLTAFLRRNYRDQSEVADLRQDIYAKVYQAARQERPKLVKAFIFAIARNLLIDRARAARVVQIDTMGDLSSLNVIADEIPADRSLSARHDLERLKQAIDSLPPRCRQVLILRKVEELSQREVAAEMRITQATVEKQLAKAVRVLAAMMGEAETRAVHPRPLSRRWGLWP